MKKTIIVTIFISIALIVTSCGTAAQNEVKNDNTGIVQKANGQGLQKTTDEKNDQNSNSDKNQSNLDSANGMTYEITTGSYNDKDVNNDKDIKIIYPQITNFSDINTQKTINELIKNEALKILNHFPYKEKFSLEVNYDIKWKSANLLSIQYSGISYVKGGAYPNHLFYTTNININKGCRIRLKDLVIINEDFVKKFKDGKFIALNPVHKDILKTFTSKDWVKDFNNADSPGNIDAESYSGTFSYLTKDSLGISVGVPHAIGDHAEFEIHYQDIANNIKDDNETWKDFSDLFQVQGTGSK